MVNEKVTIKNPGGLHLRPADILCNKIVMFQPLITFRSGINSAASARNVLSVLGACVKCGDEIEFVCKGNDGVEALAAMVGAVRDGLGEQDF